MRKNRLAFLCVVFGILLFPLLVSAGTTPGSGIKLTAHDLSTAGAGAAWGDGMATDTLDRVCIYCHAPHHTLTPAAAAAAGINYYPLWNHPLSSRTYLMYQNTDATTPEYPGSIQHQLNADLTGQPGGVSKLCLSCHDGSVATNAYGFAPAGSRSTGSKNLPASSRFAIGFGGDLRNHHPIGFNYSDVAAADDEIWPSTQSLLGANTYGLTIGDLLWGGKVECTSCHDVHNTKNEGQKFTWVEDTRSNLCFSCHNK
jgi:predicted CXXCH cytochrome family protein